MNTIIKHFKKKQRFTFTEFVDITIYKKKSKTNIKIPGTSQTI